MNSQATFFVQECPTCGRRLRVCVEYLGRNIQCRHCSGEFVAHDRENSGGSDRHSFELMQRVNELLTSSGPINRPLA